MGRPLAVVTPTLDGGVLAALARADEPFTTGQLHRILTGASEDGIRRVLRRLAGQGVVTAVRVGNAYTYGSTASTSPRSTSSPWRTS